MGARTTVVALVALSAATASARAPELGAKPVLEPARLARALPAPDPGLDEIARRGQSWRIETERGVVRVWVPAAYDPATFQARLAELARRLPRP